MRICWKTRCTSAQWYRADTAACLTKRSRTGRAHGKRGTAWRARTKPLSTGNCGSASVCCANSGQSPLHPAMSDYFPERHAAPHAATPSVPRKARGADTSPAPTAMSQRTPVTARLFPKNALKTPYLPSFCGSLTHIWTGTLWNAAFHSTAVWTHSGHTF